MKLYARIWLVMVLTVSIFALVVGVFFELHASYLREQFRNQTLEAAQQEDGKRAFGPELDVRNLSGQLVGKATRFIEASREQEELVPSPTAARGIAVRLAGGEQLEIALPPARAGVHLGIHQPWYFSPWGVLVMLSLMAVCTALAVYPVVRRLTRRLEFLQLGIERWGLGDLSARVTMSGSDEAAFLARKFNDAATQVQVLIGAHKSLLANASHELRSPLARIRMGLALLQQQTGAQNSQALPSEQDGAQSQQTSSAESHECLPATAEIERNIQELDSLIEEILLASRLDSPNANIGSHESFDLMGLSAEECARVGAQLQVQGDSHGTFEMLGYPKLMRRLLRNLLENAHRHNRPELGEVSLTLDTGGGCHRITVRDHGLGVPAQEVERIFEPFYRAKTSSQRDGGGFGLGLALVRSIAQRHGGDVYCVASQNAGADSTGGCFVVTLPITSSAALFDASSSAS